VSTFRYQQNSQAHRLEQSARRRGLHRVPSCGLSPTSRRQN
jgi:hypothetical protein